MRHAALARCRFPRLSCLLWCLLVFPSMLRLSRTHPRAGDRVCSFVVCVRGIPNTHLSLVFMYFSVVCSHNNTQTNKNARHTSKNAVTIFKKRLSKHTPANCTSFGAGSIRPIRSKPGATFLDCLKMASFAPAARLDARSSRACTDSHGVHVSVSVHSRVSPHSLRCCVV